jgi:hypothetical protein
MLPPMFARRLACVCVASTVDVVTLHATPHQPGEELALAVSLDMAAWWQPTAKGYFRHVPKAAILQAVVEYAPEHVTRLAKLKKVDIASEAERLADGTGWMPAILKGIGPQEESLRQDGPEDAEALRFSYGSSRRRNNGDRHRTQAVPSWARRIQNPGAAVAAPGVEVQRQDQAAL